MLYLFFVSIFNVVMLLHFDKVFQFDKQKVHRSQIKFVLCLFMSRIFALSQCSKVFAILLAMSLTNIAISRQLIS